MRRTPILSLVLALFILGGLLALFPEPWMVLVQALLVLVTAQIVLWQRHLQPLASDRNPVVMAKSRNPADPASADGASSAPSVAAVAPAAAAPVLDSALFSRFQSALDRAEKGGAPGVAKAAPESNDAFGADVQDRVQLSGRARQAGRPQGPPDPQGKPAPRRAERPATRPSKPDSSEGDGPDLFDDLRPAPLASARTKAAAPAPASAAPQSAPQSAAAAATGSAGSPSETPEPVASPPRHDAARHGALEHGAAAGRAPVPAAAGEPTPSGNGGGGDAGRAVTADLADESETLLRMAEEAIERGDRSAARAGLDNYLAHLADAPRLVHWRARRLECRLAVLQSNANRALQGFEAMLDAGYQPDEEGVPPLLDGLLAGAEAQVADGLRVSMLVRILAGFRSARMHSAMDRAYTWIEEAQERVGDERRLLQYLKNHLEIRKVMNDLEGQLELIDQLGNRCFKLGLTEEAQTYYEMGLQLRGGEPKEGETASTAPGEEPESGAAAEAPPEGGQS